MSGQTALVTGGCGFVGRHFVKALVNRDFQVKVVDDLSTGLSPEAWPRHLQVRNGRQVSFHIGDFRDYTKENSADFDLIIHLAAVVGGRMKIEGDPLGRRYRPGYRCNPFQLDRQEPANASKSPFF